MVLSLRSLGPAVVPCFWALALSCTTLPKKPDVALEGIRIGKISLSDVEMNVALKVTNPNDFSLKIAGIDYKINSLGMNLGEGQTIESLELPGKSSQVVTLPLNLKSEAVLQFAQAYLLRSDELIVKLLGQVKVDSPIGALSLDFNEEKNLRK